MTVPAHGVLGHRGAVPGFVLETSHRTGRIWSVFAWPPPCYQRAVAYVTDPSGSLLVFDHVGIPEAGTQVPGGGIGRIERPEAAVLRELAEELGITDATLIRKLGESWFRAEAGQVPAGYEEQVHHAFHLGVDRPNSSTTWEWDECDGGEEFKWRYTFRWIAVDAAGALLHPSQAMWLPVLRCSLSQAWSPEG